jgi:hypothetical protein
VSFLQPFLLWGLAAAAVPVIIHLLNRRRFRTVQWAAMQFLLKATQESRGKKRLKHILILTCRALAIAALAFAIARPLTGGLLGWGSGSVDTVVLLLDRSASMERTEGDGQPSKRNSILKKVSSAMAELDGARLVLIDSASGAALEVSSPDVLPTLSATAPTDSAADIPAMLLGALDYLTEAKVGRSEIWIASDLQSSDWQADDPRWEAFRAHIDTLAQAPQVRVLALKSRKRNDFSIQLLSARRENDELLVDVEIFRDTDERPTKIPITTSLMGASTTKDVEFEGQSLRYQERLPLEGNESGGYGWVALGPDANPRNNVTYFAFGADAPVHTYLITESSTSEEALTALTRASAPGFASQEVTLLAPESAHLIEWNKASLVLWRAPLPEGVLAEQFLAYLQSGGVGLFLPPDEESDQSFVGISWEPVSVSPEGRYFIVPEWEHLDGPLRDGVDSAAIPLQRLRAIKRRGLEGSATTLASWDDDTPFLSRKVIDKGTAYFLSTHPDYTWSNLEHTAVHLVLTQRALALGSRRLGAGLLGIAGDESALPEGDEIRSRVDNFAEADPTNADYHAAVYRLGERTVAVNRPTGEDDVVVLDTARLQNELLEGTGARLFEESAASTSALVQEVWRAFLIAMLLFLLAEALLCLQPKKSAEGLSPKSATT